MDSQFCTVEEALEELRAGHLIITIDDPDRENEGDLICAAQFATTENVNFMAVHAKGLICTPMSAEIAGRPVWQQGSRVTYKVAPAGSSRQSARAARSAWRPPHRACQPWPMMCPSRTRTAPTRGLGLTQPAPRSASVRARRI